MKNSQILTLGKGTFLISFLAGNICLFGYITFRNVDFAYAGFCVLILASILNLIVFLSLIIYGLFNSEELLECLKSAAILLINIPIAWLYAAIGSSIM